MYRLLDHVQDKLNEVFEESKEWDLEIGGTFSVNHNEKVIHSIESEGRGTAMKFFFDNYFPYTFHTHPPIEHFQWYPPSAVDLLDTIVWGSHIKYKDEDDDEEIWSEMQMIKCDIGIFIYHATDELRKFFYQEFKREDQIVLYDMLEYYLEVMANLIMNKKINLDFYLEKVRRIDFSFLENFLLKNEPFHDYFDKQREDLVYETHEVLECCEKSKFTKNIIPGFFIEFYEK